MRSAMLFLGAGCVAIGLAPVVFWPAIARAVEVWQPVWAGAQVPVPLTALSRIHVALAAVAFVAAVLLWRKARRSGLSRVLTWDCGYAAPTARMQYTAGSFAGIITEWFAWILRPVRHAHLPEEAFPVKASFSQHTPETVLQYAVEPTGSAVMHLALVARRFQHGRVQAYLLYLLMGVAALAGLVWLGAGN